MPDATVAELTGIDAGWVIGGPSAVPEDKLVTGIEWRRISGRDRYDTLRIVGEAAKIVATP